MAMENIALYLMFVPALVVSILTSIGAKKRNAEWRERRARRAAERPATATTV